MVRSVRPYFSTPTVITFGVSFELLFFSRERRSTGSNDCFVVLVVLVVVLVVLVVLVFYPLVIRVKKSFCAVCYGTFCAFPWHISLFVPCYGTFCAFPWHISLFVP
jgi:hypothetical protein